MKEVSLLLLGQKLAKVILKVEDKTIELQFWPESLSDTLDIEYGQIEAIGSDIAVPFWVRTGKREISFDVLLYRETLKEIPPGKYFLDKYNYDINKTVAMLRSLMYPNYEKDSEGVRAVAPKVVTVCFPNTLLTVNPSGEKFFKGLMTKCDVEYLKWYPNGVPRLAKVSLSFQEFRDEWIGRSELERWVGWRL